MNEKFFPQRLSWDTQCLYFSPRCDLALDVWREVIFFAANCHSKNDCLSDGTIGWTFLQRIKRRLS